jgi:hypothetical protein
MRELFFYDERCIFIYLRLNYLSLNGSFSYDVSLYFKALVQIAADLASKKESLGTWSCVVFHVSDVKALYVCLTNRLIGLPNIWYLFLSAL